MSYNQKIILSKRMLDYIQLIIISANMHRRSLEHDNAGGSLKRYAGRKEKTGRGEEGGRAGVHGNEVTRTELPPSASGSISYPI